MENRNIKKQKIEQSAIMEGQVLTNPVGMNASQRKRFFLMTSQFQRWRFDSADQKDSQPCKSPVWKTRA